MALVFPAELLGSKLLWWTWHDTDPTVEDRFLNVPYSILASHAYSAASFHLCLEFLRSRMTIGFEFQEANAVTEYGVMAGAICLALPVSMLAYGLTFQLFIDLLHVSSHIVLTGLVVLSTLWVWASDRRGGDSEKNVVLWQYDGEWHHSWYDHALVQASMVYLGLMPLLLVVVNPSHLVSLGYHQLLGNCSHTTTYSTLFGTPQTKFTYLCVLHFDEAFSFCGAPRSQLHVNDPWYKICGVEYAYNAFPNYLIVCAVATVTVVLVLREIFSLNRPAWVRRLPSAIATEHVKVES
ncbi:hypothetical protein, variant [Aphanomyces invadans]|nr:hypothetical protein, variant [Aphanomyces invadans]ETV93883.1 hypothetical protein, variant [Aphanomyces invadans]|eukprot:XP_008877442.1 hypothetical protein, variant [Aphanomyces invadans]